MPFCISCVYLFQLSYRYWRTILKGFLYIVATYSILAIIIVYILSFHDILLKFQSLSGLDNKM